jgi:hypothetical protein
MVSPTLMPGLGFEPRWPEGHPVLSRARLTSSATPAEASAYVPGKSVSAGKRSGPLNWNSAKKAVNASSSNSVHFIR